jgi:hypothetical protein
MREAPWSLAYQIACLFIRALIRQDAQQYHRFTKERMVIFDRIWSLSFFDHEKGNVIGLRRSSGEPVESEQ